MRAKAKPAAKRRAPARPRGLVAIDPPALGKAVGYANGVLAPRAGRQLFVAGQIAWDAEHRIVGHGDVAAQFAQALRNVLEVVRAAGGGPEHVAQLTVFVADIAAYARARRAIGESWRAIMGRRFPAMALVEVKALLEPGALVEIQGTAVVP